MPLPPIAFYLIYEVSARVGCSVADVAGWAATGQLTAMIGIEPVQCGETLHGGLVEVPMADLMPLFRRFGSSDETCRLKRILPAGGRDWLIGTAPAKGIPVRANDLMFPADPRRFAQVFLCRQRVETLVDHAAQLLCALARRRHAPFRPAPDRHAPLPPGKAIIEAERARARALHAC